MQYQHADPPSRRKEVWGLVVYIGGACRGKGARESRASYGVYFGPGSPHNASGPLPSTVEQSRVRAVIEALATALNSIRVIQQNDPQVVYIKIATDSSYLVGVMTRAIEDWIKDNGIGSNGQAVAHYNELKDLHGLLHGMEHDNNQPMYIQFWHVDRSMIEDANALANAALDAAPVSQD
ncbi:hypothetical protein E8E11_007105 [Didymella keratinophila]|nr:hypothetical protein E8E11_007105 [Didymella keratinophila]